MQCNMLTFELAIAILTFIKRLILHMNIGRWKGVLFNFIVLHQCSLYLLIVMLNMNIIFRQMFLECTKCTF